MSPKNLTRREFIKAGTIAAAGTLIINYPQSLFGKIDLKSRVILIRNRNVLDDTGKVIPDVIQEMLDESVKAILEIDELKKAWEKIIKPNDIVGIKTNDKAC